MQNAVALSHQSPPSSSASPQEFCKFCYNPSIPTNDRPIPIRLVVVSFSPPTLLLKNIAYLTQEQDTICLDNGQYKRL